MKLKINKIIGFPIVSRPKRVAIEFASDWVKIAESVWTPQGYKLAKLKAKRMVDIKDNLSSALLELFNQMNIKKGAVTLIIPRHLVTLKYLELPSTENKEIQEILDLQITKQTPYSRQEIVYGFKVIKGKKEGYSNVLLAIAKKSVIEERLNLLKGLGLEPESVVIGSGMAYQNFFLSDKYKDIRDKTALLIDIDAQVSDILIVNKGELVFTRNISLGRDAILRNPDELKNKFVAELRAALEVYRHETDRPDIENILCLGVTSGLEDILTFLRTEFNLPLDVISQLDIQFFSKELIPAVKDTGETISLSAIFGVVRSPEKPDINLLPQEFEIEKKMRYKAKNISHTGILGISILILLSAFLLQRFYREKSYYEILHNKFLKTEKESSDIERMKLKVSAIRRYLDRKNSPLNILQELINAMPKEAYFHNIIYTKDKEVVLTGSSETMSDVFKFVSVLEGLDCFEKVKTNYATKKQKEGREIIDFELVCPLQK
jgi:Tfp pilus assembly PilM family ATPase/Tfp pilus assembly protein PilN